MISFEQQQILRRLIHHKAVISVASGCDAFPAHPHGDRRRRPVFWVPAKDMQALNAAGALEMDRFGYCVAPSVKRRLQNGKDATAQNQHYDLKEQDVYISGGSRRKARVNTRLSALDRLANQTDINGKALLDANLIEAGKRIAQDYNASGHGLTATQRYDGAGVLSESNTVEDHYIRSADAKARLRAARDAMGAGLDGAVIAVCCLDQSLDAVERAERWAQGSGLTILTLGLSRLSAHYGTIAGENSKPHKIHPRQARSA